ncbi:MAG: C69 family dipeptidase [Muribaculaceae bacterium]|nr:C69 family dipeptidase [Muribaculaceae bacterium]
MKKILSTTIFSILATASSFACTSLIATKGATADGSNIISYAADSHVLYGELYQRPAADHKKGAMRDVIDWDTNKYLGKIPEPAHTYGRIGNINEHGVAIGESTWGGRPELGEPNGIIDYGSLIYIALERSKTAREAIKVMTDLVNEYGYASSGESFSIADPNEVWVMELIGKGKDEKGAVWVARRVPDGFISGHANHSRIHKFPLNDPETLYSPDVISFARKKGLFDGKDEDFDFSKAYAELDFGALRGCDARVWSYFNKYTDNAEEYLPWIMEAAGEPMPLWVKPNRKLTTEDIKWMMRDHYEDTPFDMTKDAGAGPFNVPYRYRPMAFKVDGKEYTHERAIATQQTGFSWVAQLRNNVPDAMKGILWFGTDDANTSVYMPILCWTRTAPKQLGKGDLNTLDWDSNFWVNNYVANQAYSRYSRMIPDIRRVQSELENSMINVVKLLEIDPNMKNRDYAIAKSQELADYWAAKCTSDYKALGDYLFVKHLDGNIKDEDENHNFLYTPEGFVKAPKFGGYDNPEYFRQIVKSSGNRLEVKEIK